MKNDLLGENMCEPYIHWRCYKRNKMITLSVNFCKMSASCVHYLQRQVREVREKVVEIQKNTNLRQNLETPR